MVGVFEDILALFESLELEIVGVVAMLDESWCCLWLETSAKKMQKKNVTKKSKNENKNIIIERSGFLLIACLEENWRVHYGRIL